MTKPAGRDAQPTRLIRRPPPTSAQRAWDGDARRLLAAAPDAAGWAPWQVLGGPGTGKTALLTDYAVDRIAGGADPESVLLLTHSRSAADTARAAVTVGLLGRDGVGVRNATREPLVRTVHSYAFAVLRLQAAAHGNPPPRLMTGAEQDAVIREMLLGDLEDGSQLWPERLRPALALGGFATELRDLLLRASERGLGPEDLVKLGRKRHRPEWVAAGKFATGLEQSTLLRFAVGVEAPEASAPALDAAELVGAALSAFAADRELLARERHRIRHLLVDDAQHLDPQAAELVRLVGTGTAATVIAGDPDQGVFAFRGADSAFLTGLPASARQDTSGGGRRVLLFTNHRAARRLALVAARTAARLPGLPPHRGAGAVSEAEPGQVRVEVAATVAKEAALIADHLRRAHLYDGVPWSEMAVLMRSVPLSLAPLRRALAAAGVPTNTPVSDLPLARQRGAAWMLQVLRAIGAGDFTADDALALLAGPVGGADPVALRRLRRGVRRVAAEAGRDEDSAEVLRAVLADAADQRTEAVLAGLTDVEAAPLRRVLKVLARARTVRDAGKGVEDVLWAAWQASGLERGWSAASARNGPLGAQADRDLDSVVALFDAAAAYVDRLPRAGVEGFVDYLERQQIPGGPGRAGAAEPEAVALLNAHAAVGREWTVVAVAGVQEGLWPGLRSRGTLLGTEDLVDLAAGTGGDGERMSRTAPLLAEERRLLLVACSRARRSLLVTAVESAAGDRDLAPSRFINELLADTDEFGENRPAPDRTSEVRVLALPALVAELRAVVCDPDVAERDPARHRAAAQQLARLAAAGVRGAHPDEWYATVESSSQRPMWDGDSGPVRVSPSVVEQLTTCPLRWALQRHGGDDGANVHAIKGNVVHTLVQAVAGGVPETDIRRALEVAWQGVDLGSDWHSRQELHRADAMLETFTAWLRASRLELTLAGVEVVVDCLLPARSDDEPEVRIAGRIDRLERDPDGRVVVVDMKTGKNPITKAAAREHPQLATYQVAVAAGLPDAEDSDALPEPGGGRLVYVAKPNAKEGATQRLQPPLDSADLDRWRDTIHGAAAATQGPGYLAVVNDGCRHCPVRTSCPAQDSGRQVTNG